MPQYIAFLRGINVGGHRVKMDRLRTIFEELGVTEVSTFIASGNVVFESDSKDPVALSDAIERQLARELGYEVATFLRSPAELANIASLVSPTGDSGGAPDESHYVMFLRDPAPDSLRSALADLETDMDEFRFSGAEVHWRIRGRLSDSPLFGKPIERATRSIPLTMRNMNTLRRLIASVGTV